MEEVHVLVCKTSTQHRDVHYSTAVRDTRLWIHDVYEQTEILSVVILHMYMYMHMVHVQCTRTCTVYIVFCLYTLEVKNELWQD